MCDERLRREQANFREGLCTVAEAAHAVGLSRQRVDILWRNVHRPRVGSERGPAYVVAACAYPKEPRQRGGTILVDSNSVRRLGATDRKSGPKRRERQTWLREMLGVTPSRDRGLTTRREWSR